MTRNQIVAMLDKAVEEHEKYRYYEGQDMLGELEFYIAKYDNLMYEGIGKEISIDWSTAELGAVLV